MRLGDLDVLKAQLKKLPMMSNWGEAFIPRLIDEQPTIDAVPVVRCRECVHSSMPSGFTQRYGEAGTLSCHFGPCNRRNVNENDFCSYGQRKEAAHD